MWVTVLPSSLCEKLVRVLLDDILPGVKLTPVNHLAANRKPSLFRRNKGTKRQQKGISRMNAMLTPFLPTSTCQNELVDVVVSFVGLLCRSLFAVTTDNDDRLLGSALWWISYRSRTVLDKIPGPSRDTLLLGELC